MNKPAKRADAKLCREAKQFQRKKPWFVKISSISKCADVIFGSNSLPARDSSRVS
jgi:hypothetical protein